MSKFYLLPILAIVAVIFVIRTVIMGSMPPPIAAPVVQPAQAPYETFVAGSGIIEASSENISIASPLAGVIKEVFVKAGDKVSVNQPLFSLDDRSILAELLVNEAQVTKAKASLADAETQLSFYRGVKDERAITRGELLKRESALLLAQAGVAQADATVMASRTTIDRMTIRSPLNGEVLQLRARVGEFAPAQIMITPLMVIGTVYPLGVRVDIDENDAWRVESGRPGLATLRGNTALSFPLTFVRFEPYVVPKRSLTGESTERVDTRVLQVIYSFDRGTLPIYVGQLVDVFIESKS